MLSHILHSLPIRFIGELVFWCFITLVVICLTVGGLVILMVWDFKRDDWKRYLKRSSIKPSPHL
jgi:heme/copper-type cytochrome/quinol oxidase subunit 2